MTKTHLKIVIVGAGAAGYFSAITCAETFPEHSVFLLEKTAQVLAKVRISGGGRCNITHACFDPAELVKHYPRGQKELRGPFSYFQPLDTIEWFEKRGVALKTEEDGRMFPITDQSETIIQCLQNAAEEAGVKLLLQHGIESIQRQVSNEWLIQLTGGKNVTCDRLLIATGSAGKIYPLLESLGHTTIPLVPSLFTFNLPTSPFLDLAGISVSQVSASLPQLGFTQKGPLLLTHWGFSGPAILKLSAWAARELHAAEYKTDVCIDWLPAFSKEELRLQLEKTKQTLGAKLILSSHPFPLPKQLWHRLATLSDIPADLRWSSLTQRHMQNLQTNLQATRLKIQGKTTYKQEFVTCGGIPLQEVNFKTMESRLSPGLYFAGEVLNIDGVTGGFNFQNAWTTGWLAGRAIGIQCSSTPRTDKNDN